MRLLVTNDDGIEAPGLHALARAMVDAGHDVVVAAPIGDRSGSGAAIGNIQPEGDIRAEPYELPDLPGITAFGVDGPPALAVMAGRLGAFGPPADLIVAGINPGNNTGRATLHSGTVGAALTAVELRVLGGRGEHRLVRRAALGRRPVPTRWPRSSGSRTRRRRRWSTSTCPTGRSSEVRGVRWAELAPFGTVRVHVGEPVEGRLQVELRETGQVLPPDTDTALVEAGFAAVTLLTGIRAAPRRAGGGGDRAVRRANIVGGRPTPSRPDHGRRGRRPRGGGRRGRRWHSWSSTGAADAAHRRADDQALELERLRSRVVDLGLAGRRTGRGARRHPARGDHRRPHGRDRLPQPRGGPLPRRPPRRGAGRGGDPRADRRRHRGGAHDPQPRPVRPASPGARGPGRAARRGRLRRRWR